MKIKEITATRGPNYWSVRRPKLIVMVLDLEEIENSPSNEIEGFNKRLKNLLPGLEEHRCSEGKQGGFLLRLDEGTWMGHVIEHVALEIQCLAGMETSFGRTRGYGEKGVYHVVFEYTVENAGRYAARAAVNICEALIANRPYEIDKDIQELRELKEDGRLGPSTEAIIKEAERRGIPWLRLNEGSLCQLGYGANQRRIQATITSRTSNIGVDIACDKEDTKNLLRQASIKVPYGKTIWELSELEEACEDVGYPLTIKPINGNHGRGITSNIHDLEQATAGFHQAKKISDTVIVENHIYGSDFRILVINYKFVAAARRSPAQVTGDGHSTIAELVELTNRDPRRGFRHENLLTKIEIDKTSLKLINKKGYDLNSILPAGEHLILKDTANLSTGGTAEDVTDIVHPSNIFLAERIAKLIDLDICGIDLITSDISKPIEETGGSVIEVNAGPGFRMHLAPTVGLPRNVAAPVLDSLFPDNKDGKIPIIAVTGTNGKTTTTRLIAHMAKLSGKLVGYTTTDGVYIQNRMVMKGDCTGPVSTELVLRDPNVNFAVLECARGGLLRAGLAFKTCDIGIVTNVEGDHLGLDGIHTQEQLAKVKSVIPETVKHDGYSILNADDDLVFGMRKYLKSKIALFSMDENNPRIQRFQEEGGITAVFENGYITLTSGVWKMRVMKVENIPLTFNGKAKFMIQNILPAVLAAQISGFSIEDMRTALQSFVPSDSQTPGRLNIFRFKNFSFMIDYAHNPTGMRALKDFIDSLDFKYKVGIIAGIGDRLDSDTEKIGLIAAEMFDEIIIRNDRDLRGKSAEYLTSLLRNGINKTDPKKLVTLAGSEPESIKYAIGNAKKDSLIVLCSDAVGDSLKLLNELKQKDDRGELKFENSFWLNTF
ncbi:cyanophycin synthetase [Gramella jeungdoensis]|uniref:Cyanophycin synthetase n=1 Tax=Gramella jeungdoensis TaxID=708091 RepID=A0ABT0Z4G3_9FLAO|nr:cyanophycin synthetase [Gramella jeungdoensis]MCM8570611.1 cyanophycin synthetase [Gramella jeungdoensis]